MRDILLHIVPLPPSPQVTRPDVTQMRLVIKPQRGCGGSDPSEGRRPAAERRQAPVGGVEQLLQGLGAEQRALLGGGGGDDVADALEEGASNLSRADFDSLLDIRLARTAEPPVTPLPIIGLTGGGKR